MIKSTVDCFLFKVHNVTQTTQQTVWFVVIVINGHFIIRAYLKHEMAKWLCAKQLTLSRKIQAFIVPLKSAYVAYFLGTIEQQGNKFRQKSSKMIARGAHRNNIHFDVVNERSKINFETTAIIYRLTAMIMIMPCPWCQVTFSGQWRGYLHCAKFTPKLNLVPRARNPLGYTKHLGSWCWPKKLQALGTRLAKTIPTVTWQIMIYGEICIGKFMKDQLDQVARFIMSWWEPWEVESSWHISP